MTLHIGIKAAVDCSETCTADRLDDCASVVVRAVGIGLLWCSVLEVKESTHQAKILVKIQLLSLLVSIIRHISNAVPGIL